MSESKEVSWLKEALCETPLEEDALTPSSKRIKVADQSLEAHFAPTTYSHNAVSTLISEAFPRSFTKRAGKSRLKHVHGVCWQQSCTPSHPQLHAGFSREVAASSSSDRVLAENIELKHQVKELQMRIQELEEGNNDRVVQLESRVRDLEKCSGERLVSEGSAIVRNKGVVVSGPDTPEHLKTFTIDGALAELKSHAPNLLDLVLNIAKSDRNLPPDEDASNSVEKLKALVSVCTLLNARSARAKGMQLMISLMLIARATSRQVRIHYIQ